MRQPFSFLIVEDEALLAMDMALLVEECGHRVSGEAASLSEVAALPEELAVDCAFVDVQLLHGSSGIDAAWLLRQLGPKVRILCVTANPTRVPPGFAGGVGIMQKPFTRYGLIAAIGYLAETNGSNAEVMPPGVVAIPQQA